MARSNGQLDDLQCVFTDVCQFLNKDGINFDKTINIWEGRCVCLCAWREQMLWSLMVCNMCEFAKKVFVRNCLTYTLHEMSTSKGGVRGRSGQFQKSKIESECRFPCVHYISPSMFQMCKCNKSLTVISDVFGAGQKWTRTNGKHQCKFTGL